ncbi:MAG TPA: alkaline phosphatase family protein [Chthoniobacteraceae bacterium]|jgi:hypothetical protein|nr:alkaline phosphatase family protein [Chthoniobacteraceae bacterium]
MSPSLDLFVFADALGWTQVEKRGFMADLFPHRAPCDTIFGYSASCDPSILTGALPAQHGHFSFFVFAPERSPFGWARRLGWLPQAVAAHHRVRNRISRWVAARNGYTGYFQLYSVPFSQLPWFDYTEKRDIYEPGGINGGQRAIFEDWKACGMPWSRSDWSAGDTANIARLRGEIDRGEVRLAYLFTAGLDATMHAHTTNSPETDAAFAKFERSLRELHALAVTRYREVRIHLFSDHGMTDTVAVSRMMVEFEQAGYHFPRDYAAVWDSTMARFWFPGGDSAREEIHDWLRARKEGRILTREELESWGCWFPDHRYGELFFLLNNGAIFAPSFMNRGRVPGMHGFDPREPDSRACWLTTHELDFNPRRINEIYHVMRAAAGRPAISQIQ